MTTDIVAVKHTTEVIDKLVATYSKLDPAATAAKVKRRVGQPWDGELVVPSGIVTPANNFVRDTNSLALVPVVQTVAESVTATVDPDAELLMVELGAMTTADLKTYIKDEIASGERVLAEEKRAADEHRRIQNERRHVTYKVVCAQRELKSRCKATKTWEKTLRECGITPGTWRSWDCRELNLLTTGKRTRSRKPKPDGRSLAQVRADVAAAKAAVDAQRAAATADELETNPVESEYVDSPAPDATAQDWSIDPDDDPGLSATDIYNDLMMLGRIAETMAESVNLGNDPHQMFVGIQERVGEVLDDIFDGGFDPAASGWMGCSSELRKQRIQAVRKLMVKKPKVK
jgi:hypothetical protein